MSESAKDLTESRGGPGHLWPVLSLVVAQAVLSVIIWPIGEIALIDDWSYLLALRWLHEDGQVVFTNWQSSTLLGHLLWSLPFVKIFGYSIMVARVSTMVASVLAVLGTYAVGYELLRHRGLAWIAAFAVASNVLFLLTSHTFLTDVPFLAMLLWATWCFFYGFRTERRWLIVVSGVLVVVSILTRQLGFGLAVAFVFVWLMRSGWTIKRMAIGAALVVASVAVYVIYSKIIASTTGLPSYYYQKSDSMKMVFEDLLNMELGAIKYPLRRGFLAVLYLGVFVLPLTMAVGWAMLREATTKARWIALATVVIATGALLGAIAIIGRPMPILADQIVDFGVGIRTMPGEAAGAPAWVWTAITVATALGGVLLIAMLLVLAHRWIVCKALPKAPELLAMIALVACLLGPSAWTYTGFFDRYFVPAIPFFAILVLGATIGLNAKSLRSVVAIGVVVLAVQACLGAAMVHDYFAWQRTSWAVAHELVDERNVPLMEMRATVEFTNWHLQTTPEIAKRYPKPVRLTDRAWTVAFSSLEGYATESTHGTGAYLPWSPQTLYLLRRTAPPVTDSAPESTP